MRNYTIFAAVMKQKSAILLSVIFSLSVFSVSGQDTIMLSDNLRLIKTCSEYIIDYWPSEILFDTLENNGEMFYRSGFADMSHVEYTEEPGFPELPIYSVSLQVPREGCEVNVYMEPDVFDFCGGNDGEATSSSEWCSELEEQNYCIPVPDNMLYYPTQSCFGETECPTEMDYGYYYNYDTSWMSMRYYYDTIPVPYMVFGSVTFNILPLHYNPEDNCLRQMPATRFVISPSCGDDLCQLEWETLQNPVWGQDAVDFFDNYVGDEYDVDEAGIRIEDYPDEDHSDYETLNTTYKGDYLIIVQDAYESEMEAFVAHKVYYGYHVVMLPLSAAESEGDSYAISHGVNNTSSLSLAEKIRYAIKGRKENNEYLKYVLLVSEQGIIPSSDDVIDSDILYGTMKMTWPQHLYLLPEIYVGRWIIEDIHSLERIIRKTIFVETMQRDMYATLCSGSGIGENKFRKVNNEVASILSNNNYSISNIVGTNSNALLQFRSAILNNNNLIWIYRGHGAIDEIGQPYNLYAVSSPFISSLIPFGFSFSCSNNSYQYDSFGSHILTLTDYAGDGTLYGASEDSNRDSNNKLEKAVFKVLSKSKVIGEMVTQGERKYYDACRTSGLKQRQVKKYNLAGDPSLYILGLDAITGEANTANSINGNRTMRAIEYNDKNNLNAVIDTEEIEVYDILGRHMGNIGTSKLYDLPPNNYILIIRTIEGLVVQKHFINN